MDKRFVKDDQIDLSSAIEQLARDAVLVEPTDLPRFGGPLNRVNSINDRINEMGLAGMASITGGLKVLIEKLIMEEVSDRSCAIEAIGKGSPCAKSYKRTMGNGKKRLTPAGLPLHPSVCLSKVWEQRKRTLPLRPLLRG